MMNKKTTTKPRKSPVPVEPTRQLPRRAKRATFPSAASVSSKKVAKDDESDVSIYTMVIYIFVQQQVLYVRLSQPKLVVHDSYIHRRRVHYFGLPSLASSTRIHNVVI